MELETNIQLSDISTKSSVVHPEETLPDERSPLHLQAAIHRDVQQAHM